MNFDLKNISNKDLIQLYRLVLEHLELLNTEKNKLEEEESK